MKLLKIITLAALPFTLLSHNVSAMDQNLNLMDLDVTNETGKKVFSIKQSELGQILVNNGFTKEASLNVLSSKENFLQFVNVVTRNVGTLKNNFLNATSEAAVKANVKMKAPIEGFFKDPLNKAFTGSTPTGNLVLLYMAMYDQNTKK